MAGTDKLFEAIDFSFGDLDLNQVGALLPGEQSDAIVIRGTMRSDAGNEYQGLSIDGISLNVTATQYMHENDSFGDSYDQDAYDGLLQAIYIKDLVEQGYTPLSGSAIGSAAGNVVITESFEPVSATGMTIESDAVVDFAGNGLTRKASGGAPLKIGNNLGSSANVVLENAKFNMAGTNDSIRIENNTNLTIRNSTFSSAAAGTTGMGGVQLANNKGGKVTLRFENVVFNMSRVKIEAYNAATEVELVFVDCTFNWDGPNFSSFVELNAYSHGRISFDNCDFNTTNYNGNQIVWLFSSTSSAGFIEAGLMNAVTFNNVRINVDAARDAEGTGVVGMMPGGVAYTTVESTGSNQFVLNGETLVWDDVVR